MYMWALQKLVDNKMAPSYMNPPKFEEGKVWILEKWNEN